ncbi:RNA 2',3'-cyclic phosphodiesterase [Salipaludibacillus keqinensis]|jgi:RNA 2',3'-cyclic 3'-phosphodiesterase|uniref:RNA 2',3'-cyclic phosphodiesterase n=1 Tax=Salipaludibacillus keqinensis TaxID=2045207 RepID=A0A323TH52_9BACI|nr:RNA 2',3'-cyclic phosphodiesterase [Salipaludibacillus keqinensis]PYZ93810.1 RNA 2',3'-cyclic phosphodiesterase [Salipaludibacillus keqinensis]
MGNHSFIGIPMSQNIKNSSESIQKTYLLSKYYKNIVHIEDFHMTLLFLGSWDPEKRVKLWKTLETKLSLFHSFSMTFSAIHYFGSSLKPRVFYLEPQKNDQLVTLQSIIQHEAEEQGFPVENRPYRPHVTLAKKWKDSQVNIENKWSFPMKIEETEQIVEQICLYNVRPNQKPMYEKISTIQLAK